MKISFELHLRRCNKSADFWFREQLSQLQALGSFRLLHDDKCVDLVLPARPVSDLRAGVSFDKARACHAISIYYYQFYSDEMPLQDLLTPVSCALLRDVLFQGQAELGGSIPLLWCAVVHQNKVGMVVIQGVGWALDIVI